MQLNNQQNMTDIMSVKDRFVRAHAGAAKSNLVGAFYLVILFEKQVCRYNSAISSLFNYFQL